MRRIINPSKLVTTLAVLITLSMLIPTISLARPRGPHQDRGPHAGEEGPRLERLSRELDLTEAQQKQVRALIGERDEARVADREALHAARQKLADTIHAETFDEAAVRGAALAVADIEANRAVARASMMHEIRQLLTEEQKARMAELREQRKGGEGRLSRQGDGSRGPGPRGRGLQRF